MCGGGGGGLLEHGHLLEFLQYVQVNSKSAADDILKYIYCFIFHRKYGLIFYMNCLQGTIMNKIEKVFKNEFCYNYA